MLRHDWHFECLPMDSRCFPRPVLINLLFFVEHLFFVLFPSLVQPYMSGQDLWKLFRTIYFHIPF